MDFKRVFNFAVVDFYRNKGMSLAAIFVLTIIVLVVTGLFLMRGVSNYLISTIENKIDITAYFKEDTIEQDILQIKEEIAKDSATIKSIEYVSKDDALADFNRKHQDNDVFSQALLEVGDNPFLPSLNIVTNGDEKEYEKVSNILENGVYKDLIERVDFYQKKDIIKKVFSITSNVNTFGFVAGIFIILIAILVVFNTMKLVIKSAKEEIATMRVMGASNWFIKAPFVIEGALFGFSSFVISILITFISVYFLSRIFSAMVPGFNLFSYFLSNFWMILFIQFSTGIALGVAASLLVVNKYLKV